MDKKDMGRKIRGVYNIEGKLKGQITDYILDDKDQFTIRLGSGKAMETLMEKGAVLEIGIQLAPKVTTEEEIFIRNMKIAFEAALMKAGHEARKPDNTLEPWKKHSTIILQQQLYEKHAAYRKNPSSQLLMDIMNTSAILFIQRMHINAEKFVGIRKIEE